MIKYPKINTLFIRDEDFKATTKLLVTAFENVKYCHISEKINGTNAQIVLNINYETLDVMVRFCSRENDIERKDIMYIADTCCRRLQLDKVAEWYFNNIALDQKTARVKDNVNEVRLFGEVYGDKINSGGIYCCKGMRDIRLFDIQIGSSFMNQSSVLEIAGELGIKVAPVLYEGPIGELLEYENIKKFLKTFNTRIIGEGGTGGLAEGIVIRSEPLLLNRFGNRIIAKIKRSDFIYEELKEEMTLNEINPEDSGRDETFGYRNIVEDL